MRSCGWCLYAAWSRTVLRSSSLQRLVVCCIWSRVCMLHAHMQQANPWCCLCPVSCIIRLSEEVRSSKAMVLLNL